MLMNYKQAWNSLKRDVEMEIINAEGRSILEDLWAGRHINLQSLSPRLKSYVIIYIAILGEENAN